MDLGDAALTILLGIAVAIPAGLGSAILWFKDSKKRLYMRVDKIEEAVAKRTDTMQVDMDRRYDKVELSLHGIHTDIQLHAIQLNGLVKDYGHIAAALEDLKNEGREQNRKLDTLLQNGR